ncbi:unnamed protein product [Protopolystoma xenopodis]|uniref:Uncharacterized protein n=1 Tax=Protopolystoma xenopodis TaxID=117903 RepID=A0A448WZX3_9PLAT|nr:unnamed protein product [Protopolystoma xenopodis]
MSRQILPYYINKYLFRACGGGASKDCPEPVMNWTSGVPSRCPLHLLQSDLLNLAPDFFKLSLPPPSSDPCGQITADKVNASVLSTIKCSPESADLLFDVVRQSR